MYLTSLSHLPLLTTLIFCNTHTTVYHIFLCPILNNQNALLKHKGNWVTSGDIIGRYERDEVKPSIEVVIRMVDALEVSLDFLVT